MERTDEWPRVRSCLNDWCPKKSDDCKRCDAVVEIVCGAGQKRTFAPNATPHSHLES